MIKSKAAIHLKKNHDLKIDQIELPDPKNNQVIVKNIATGLCGSQLINLGRDPRSPELLGHESTGVIVKKGKNVKGFKEGDEVFLSWVPSKASKDTEYLEFSDVKWRKQIISSVIFTWSEHSLVHSQFVHKKNKKVDPIPGSILGCAGITGFGLVQKYRSSISNKDICIIGFGGIGSFIVEACKHFGAKSITILDKNQKKKKLLKNIHKINNFSNLEEILSKNTKFDAVFDTVGNEQSIDTAQKITRNCVPGYSEGGCIFLIGFPLQIIPVNMRNILMQEQKIIGCRGGNIKSKVFFDYIQDLIVSKKINLSKFVSKEYNFSNINSAIRDLKAGKILTRGVVKF